MAAIQCKICGGFIELTGGQTLTECRYCGNQVTLPQVTDENHAAAFNRGNHFRRIGEFDKALAVYERIIQEDEGNAEAHWCSALCRFGIEYVKDPATGEYLPTCHRASYDSFLEDVDYLAALAHADDAARAHYQHDAEKIAQVQRGIPAVSQSEKPFDVFICYKETDASGQRTRDSQLAQDVYYQLTDQGLRVFFARITLEDKPGTQFEPYIFAALNTAKVMVVIGTKPEHLSATWVRNEWSRYLAIMKRDRSRLLIPCYRDMDPYDMPEQLSILQGYDMSRIGFIQDLVRGIRKVVGEEKPAAPAQQAAPAPTAAPAPAAPATEPLLRRVALFLEDGDWKSADEYCERVLDIDPECARAYVGKLMAALHVTRQEKLRNQAQPFDQNPNYIKALRFADEELAGELRGISRIVNENHSIANLSAQYQRAVTAMATAVSESDFNIAQQYFVALGSYMDSEVLAKECAVRADVARKEQIYSQARSMMYSHPSIEHYQEAIKLFYLIRGWKDSEQQIAICQQMINEIKTREFADREERRQQEEAQRRAIQAERTRQERQERFSQNAVQLRKALGISSKIAILVVILGIILYNAILVPASQYQAAVQMMDDGQYEEAIAVFQDLNGYKDSELHIDSCNAAIIDIRYREAVSLMNAGEYRYAITAFENLSGYADSITQIQACYYAIAEDYYRKGDNALAAINFGKAGEYRDAYTRGWNLWNSVAVRNIIAAGEYHSVGIRSDGTVTVTGGGGTKRNVANWKDIISVAANEYFNAGLRTDGTVVCTGNGAGSGKNNANNWDGIVAIETGADFLVGLRIDGTVVCTKSSEVNEWENIIGIAAGNSHIVGLRADGTVIAVGWNYDGQCDVMNWRDIVAISAKENYTLGLRADGTVVAVGENDYGQCNVSRWSDVVAIAAGDTFSVGLLSNGHVVAEGKNDDGQCDVSHMRDIVAISAGHWHTIGLCADGAVVGVGFGVNGEIAVTDWQLKQVPRPTLPK